jgi:hypothetical protein
MFFNLDLFNKSVLNASYKLHLNAICRKPASPLPSLAKLAKLVWCCLGNLRVNKQLASQLSAYPPHARGPGLVHRLGVEAQRQFLRSGPVAVGAGGKYGRRR